MDQSKHKFLVRPCSEGEISQLFLFTDIRRQGKMPSTKFRVISYESLIYPNNLDAFEIDFREYADIDFMSVRIAVSELDRVLRSKLHIVISEAESKAR